MSDLFFVVFLLIGFLLGCALTIFVSLSMKLAFVRQEKRLRVMEERLMKKLDEMEWRDEE